MIVKIMVKTWQDVFLSCTITPMAMKPRLLMVVRSQPDGALLYASGTNISIVNCDHEAFGNRHVRNGLRIAVVGS